MAPAVRQKLLEQDMAPTRRCSTSDEKEETVTGTRTRVGAGTKTSSGMITRAGIGARTGAGLGTRPQMRDRGIRARELRSGKGAWSESARGGTTQTSNKQTRPQDPMFQRNRHIIRRTRAKRREARDKGGEKRGQIKKCKGTPGAVSTRCGKQGRHRRKKEQIKTSKNCFSLQNI